MRSFFGLVLGARPVVTSANGEKLDITAAYPRFEAAAKMEMLNAAGQNNVDAKVIHEMARRADFWEESFRRGHQK